MEKPTVFISYKRDKGYIANNLEKTIGGRAEIKRDIKEIGAWESITSFMNSIRKQDFAILVISDNYLKSVACMYEVMQLLKDDDWLDKTIIMLAEDINIFGTKETSVYKGYKQDKIEMRGDRAEMSDFPLYLNMVAGGLDRRDQTIGGFSFVVKIYAVPVVEIIG